MFCVMSFASILASGSRAAYDLLSVCAVPRCVTVTSLCHATSRLSRGEPRTVTPHITGLAPSKAAPPSRWFIMFTDTCKDIKYV